MGDKEDKNEKKSNTDMYIIAIVGIAILWGLPSLISGNGFFNGIIQNFKALFYIVGLVIAVVVIFKITEK